MLWGCYDGDYDGCGMGCYDVIMYECIMDVSIMGRVRDHTTRQ